MLTSSNKFIETHLQVKFVCFFLMHMKYHQAVRTFVYVYDYYTRARVVDLEHAIIEWVES